MRGVNVPISVLAMVAVAVFCTTAQAANTATLSGSVTTTPAGASNFVFDQLIGTDVVNAQDVSPVFISGEVRLDNFNMYPTDSVWFELGLVDKTIVDWYTGSDNEYGQPVPSMIWNQSVYLIALFNTDLSQYEIHLQDYTGQRSAPVLSDGNRFEYEIELLPNIGSTNGQASLRIKPFGGEWTDWTELWDYRWDYKNGWQPVDLSEAVLIGQIAAMADYNNSAVNADFTADFVPEPTSLSLLVLGCSLLIRRRKS